MLVAGVFEGLPLCRVIKAARQAGWNGGVGSDYPTRDWVNILRSRQNPKILGRDNSEVIRYLIAVDVPFSGHVLTQEAQDRLFEVGKRLIAGVVGDIFVHQTP